MIIEQKINDDVQFIGIEESYEAKISPEHLAWIMDILSSNYKDKPGIIVQEYASNSWDSHVEVGKTDTPIVIKMAFLDEENKENPYIQFIDYGIGLSPERIRIFGDYGNSTKRNSKDQLGAFGIGSKSAYSYTSQFFIDTVYDNTLYKYVAAKNEKNIPSINLLDTNEDDSNNYSNITIFLKQDNDILTFYNSIAKKTVYFENIHYDISPGIINYLSTNYGSDYTKDLNEINLYNLRDSNFVIASNKPYDYAHLILGQIPYTLDWSLLGRTSLQFPIGIRVEVSDDIYPIKTREDVDYTPEAIAKINSLIDNLQEYIVNRFNEKGDIIIDDFREFHDRVYTTRSRGKYLEIDENIKLSYNNLEYKYQKRVKDIKIIFSKLNLLDFTKTEASWLLSTLTVRKSVDNHSFVSKNQNVAFTVNNYLQKSVYRVRKGFSKTKKIVNKYIFDKFDVRYTFYLINLPEKLSIFKRNGSGMSIKEALSLHQYPKLQWRAIIKQYLEFIHEIYNEFDYYEDIVPDNNFITAYNNKQKQLLLAKTNDPYKRGKEDLVVYTPKNSNRADSGFTFDKQYLSYKQLRSIKGLVVYCDAKQKEELGELAMVFDWVRNIHFRVLNQGEYDLLQFFENYINYDDFMDNNVKPFVRGVTCYVIQKFINENKFFFKPYNLLYIKEVSEKIYTKLVNLQEYQKKYSHLREGEKFNEQTEKFMESAMLLTPDLDPNIADDIRDCEVYLDKLKFLKLLRTDYPRAKTYIGTWDIDYNRRTLETIDIETLELTSFVLKKLFPKFRLNLPHYQNDGINKIVQTYYEKNKERVSNNY